MAFNLNDWAEIAAMISALTDVITIGKETYQTYYNRRKSDPATQRQALLLSNTFSDDEIESIKTRIKRCRDRFINEGSGEQRATCICSVLKDVKDGNGGHIPDEDWERSYEQLRCDKNAA